MLLQIVLLVLVLAAGMLFGGAWNGPLATWTMAAGIVLLLAGGLLVVRGFLDLGRNLTPMPRPREDAQLVETGVYGLVRHPLYGGIVLGSFGYGLLTASPSALLLSCGLAAFFYLKSLREEAWLLGRSPSTRPTEGGPAASSPGSIEEPGGEVGRRTPTLPPGKDAASPVPPPIVRERGRLDRGRAVERCRCVLFWVECSSTGDQPITRSYGGPGYESPASRAVWCGRGWCPGAPRPMGPLRPACVCAPPFTSRVCRGRP